MINYLISDYWVIFLIIWLYLKQLFIKNNVDSIRYSDKRCILIESMNKIN